MEVAIKDGVMLIKIPLMPEPRPSASGKTLLIASTSGNVTSNAEFGGKPVIIGMTAYIRK